MSINKKMEYIEVRIGMATDGEAEGAGKGNLDEGNVTRLSSNVGAGMTIPIPVIPTKPPGSETGGLNTGDTGNPSVTLKVMFGVTITYSEVIANPLFVVKDDEGRFRASATADEYLRANVIPNKDTEEFDIIVVDYSGQHNNALIVCLVSAQDAAGNTYLGAGLGVLTTITT